MAIELVALLKLRPIAYHTTGQLNFEAIRDQRAVISTKSLLNGLEHASLLNGRRLTSTTFLISGRGVQIRDQLPLRPKSLLPKRDDSSRLHRRIESACLLPGRDI